VTRPLLTLADYSRMHAITRAVLDGVNAHTTEACVFFSLVGAYLLEKHHKRSATPMVGAAFFGLGGDPPNVLSFARLEGDEVVSDTKAFHCWVDCEGWVIDFMAPIFPEHARRRGFSTPIPCRMFQRRLSTMADHVDLQREGEFLMIPNPTLTAELLASSLKRPATRDLANVCSQWYRPTPKKIATSLSMGSDDGSIRTLRLSSVRIVAAW
jgi:hypothetical protein